MFAKIPPVRTAVDLIDTSFKKARQVVVAFHPDRIAKTRNWDIQKIKVIKQTLVRTLSKYVKAYPKTDELPEFYRALLDVLVGIDTYKIALSSVNWAKNKIMELSTNTVRKLEHTRDVTQLRKIMHAYFGRVASIIDGINKYLEFLNTARSKLKKVPDINMTLFTIVVAGYPNVGKSEFVSKICSAKSEIAPYPFTTKGILVGHGVLPSRKKFQIIDTPGQLDRPLERRNAMERQAILALQYLADLVIFILDPSETCGYTIAQQQKLLAGIQTNFNNEIIVIENKSDLLRSNSENIKVSALTGEGLDVVLKLIESKIK